MREIVSPLDGIRSPFGRRRASSGLSVTLVGTLDTETDAFDGLTTDSIGTYGVIGEHAFIGYAATFNGAPTTLDAVIWSNQNPAGADKSGAATTYGTGSSPTDITAADEGTVFFHGRKGTTWVTRQFDVRYRPGTLPAFAAQSFTQGVGGTYQHPAATGTGLTWTYAQVGAVSGVTYNAGTRTFTYADTLALQAGTAFGASATDQYGRAAIGSPRTSTFTISDVVPAVITSLLVTGVQGTNGILPVEYTIDRTETNVAWGIGTGSTPTASALRAGTGMSDFGTVTLTAGTNTFSEDIVAGINSASLNLWMVTPGSNTVVTAAASAPGVVPFAIDTVAPAVSTLSPADGATDVLLTSNLVMTFSKAMKRQGTVDLRVVGGSSIQTFNLASAGTWSAGDTVWTGDPTSDFTALAALCVRWSGLEDTKANALADNTGDTQWNFTAGSASGYSPTFVNTNGTARYSYLGNQIAANAKMTFVARFKDVSNSTTGNFWFPNGRGVIRSTNGVLNIQIDDSANTTVYTANSTTAVLLGSTTKTLYIAVDLTVPSVTIEIDGVAPSMSVTVGPNAGNGLIGMNIASGILARDSALEILSAKVSEIFLQAGTILDPNLFYDGDHLDMDGVGTPHIYLGGGMEADAFNGNSAQGWNDSYNRGSITVTTQSATFTDAI
jgi:hypothetical protein